MRRHGLRGQSELLSALIGLATIAVSLVVALNIYGKVLSDANKVSIHAIEGFRAVGSATTATATYMWNRIGLSVIVAVSHIPGSKHTNVDVTVTCLFGDTKLSRDARIIDHYNDIDVFFAYFYNADRSNFRGCIATIYEIDTGNVYSVSFGERP